ncbi:DUF59 domain-containing protein [Beggiatoa alba]|nr:DUF59 domain-containing protein [Beggiatoa alba]
MAIVDVGVLDDGSANEVVDDISLEQTVISALRKVYDPELPVNIYDLGLIYAIQINEKAEVLIKMTLTAPGCPVAGSLPAEVECAIMSIDVVTHAQVDLVWDPPWTVERLSDETKLLLGLY